MATECRSRISSFNGWESLWNGTPLSVDGPCDPLVAGGYVVLDIVAFGLLSLLFAGELASGEPLARGVCGFICVFWGIRLIIQLFFFDARPYLRNWFLTIGFHALTVVFAWQTIVYGYASLAGL